MGHIYLFVFEEIRQERGLALRYILKTLLNLLFHGVHVVLQDVLSGDLKKKNKKHDENQQKNLLKASIHRV